ncbi:MAG: hypothetical protein A3J93_04305 [Candidatus Magasanikbacteria bacterium RIFOXYC2_FULL_42_28]|uniref:Uncharacterized protein n=1 Tax=Candidatus Magasanikbacteria bacterium RIFOXYC2_FULL_42_28 TaxID=1798704 RepID=A0A1F6NX03_9BACT|nr:MAG: hypothetical protein A3J93_04305 [Candidatus Magasanikbacteria bacterium RIFOXYC2_FULL_42_28]
MFKRLVIIFLTVIALAPTVVWTQPISSGPRADKVDFTLFHLETCPHCRAEIAFINSTLKPKYSEQVNFSLYELTEPASLEKLKEFVARIGAKTTSVPITFIDDKVFYGYSSDVSTGDDLIGAIEKAIKTHEKTQDNVVTDSGPKVNVPILGEINPQKFSLPLLTVVVGLLDGFNPCAMWVLLFLITLLLGMESRKRMLLLGGIFIITSGVVYFAFMAAWFNFITFIGSVFAIRALIGAVAVGIGGKNLYDFWKNRKADGVVCEVSNQSWNQKIFAKIKDIVHRQSLWWSVLGIILLGFSVNLVEMACSAGFPAIYTQVLAMSGIPTWQKYLYMVGYIIFYMLDDMIVFAVAMVTLKQKVFGTKYAKYTNLVAGALILILGVLLIFKPEWVMFS